MLIGLEISHFSMLKAFSVGTTGEQLQSLRRKIELDTEVAEKAIEQGEEQRHNHTTATLSNSGTAEIETPFTSCPHAIQHLSAFIGRNATGKTAVFEALDFMADCVRYNVTVAAMIKGRKGIGHLRTFGESQPLTFVVHCLMPETAEVMTWTLRLDGDEYDRPLIVYESVTAFSCTKRYLEELGIPGVRSFFKKGIKRYTEDRTYFVIEEGAGEVYNNGKMIPTKLIDWRRSALALYGNFAQYKQLAILAEYVSHWYYCRMGTPEEQQMPLLGVHEAYSSNPSSWKDSPGHKHLDVYARNVDNVLVSLKKQEPETYRKIMANISERMPGTRKLSRRQAIGALSSSENKLFIILLLLEDPQPRRLIMLENPDTGLFHDMVDDLGFAMRDYVVNNYPLNQLFFTTHNTMMIDSLRPEEVWHFVRCGDDFNCEDDDYYEEDLYGFEREDSSFGGGLQDGQVNSNGETRLLCC